MVQENKRKRDLDIEDEAGQPPTKLRPTEGQALTNKKTHGEHRQMKSERRKKNSIGTKKKASKKAADNTSANTAGYSADMRAVGQAAMSLSNTDALGNKKKRRSPRAIRKEARQQKIDAGLIEDASSKVQGTDLSPNTRFICFVGNLPYTTTVEQIAAHFSKLQPSAIRLSTNKDTGECKGFAFLEFENYDRMKTCLKIYHHSIFNPEQEGGAGEEVLDKDPNSKPQGRKINVELTAGGGGGKSAGRRDKIKSKNKKLGEERARDRKKEKHKKFEKGRGQGRKRDVSVVSGANLQQHNEATSDDRGDIHPSRLNRVGK